MLCSQLRKKTLIHPEHFCVFLSPVIQYSSDFRFVVVVIISIDIIEFAGVVLAFESLFMLTGG